MESKTPTNRAAKALAGYTGTAPRIHFIDWSMKGMHMGALCRPPIEARQIWEAHVVRQAAVSWYILRDVLRDIETAKVPMTDSMLAGKAHLDDLGSAPHLSKHDFEVAFSPPAQSV